MTGQTFRQKTAAALAGIYTVFLLVQPAMAAGGANEAVAKATELTGRVSVTRTAVNRAIPAALGLPLFLKDLVTTRAASRAKILFVDNTMLTVAPETRLVIEKYLFDADKGVRRGLVRLTAGAVKLTTSQLMGLKDKRFQIKTVTATVGVRSTEVIVITGRGKPPAGLGTPPTRQTRRAQPVQVAMLGPLGPLGPIVVAQVNDPYTFICNVSLGAALVYVMLNSNPSVLITLPPGFFVWAMAGFVSAITQLTPAQAVFLGVLFNMVFQAHLLQIMIRYGMPFLPGSSLYHTGGVSTTGSQSGGQTGGQIRSSP